MTRGLFWAEAVTGSDRDQQLLTCLSLPSKQYGLGGGLPFTLDSGLKKTPRTVPQAMDSHRGRDKHLFF